jgi:hypothetical protein
MVDNEFEKLIDKAVEQKPKTTVRKRDEVDEAGDSSFPASDPPAYTSAAPRKSKKFAKDPEH